MDSTIVEVLCVSKNQKRSGNATNPTAHEIELEVPYDQNNIYYKMSGGTNLKLNTINDGAANMFEIGKKYNVVISPSSGAEGN